MIDLELRDTPALAILRQRPELLRGVDPAAIAGAQDLLRMSKRLLAHFAEAFALHGLSPSRYAVLMALYAPDTVLSPSDLADRLGVTRATITGLIAGLVRDRLVCDVPGDESDRRRRAVALTDAGRAVLAKAVPDIFTQMVGLLAPLSEDERTTLLRLTRQIEARLTRPPAPEQEQTR